MLADPATGATRPADPVRVPSGHRRALIAGLVVLLLAGGLLAVIVAGRLNTEAPIPLRPLPPAAPVVDASLRNCVVSPSVCGYPDGSNTGVPASVVLKSVPAQVSSGPGWHWDSRGWVEIDGNNALFTGYSVNASVDVTAFQRDRQQQQDHPGR